MATRTLRLAALPRCLVALLYGLPLLACVQDDGSRFNPIAAMTTVSEEEEREIGFEFDQAIRKQVQVIEDPVVAGFINDLGQEIVRTLEPQPFIYRFRIIEADSLNAFAVPGGYIFFHSATVLAAGSIEELAGIMGHEIAHVKGHHYARMRKKSQIPDILVGLAGLAAAIATNEPGALIATQAANQAIKLKFSREFENEADKYGGIFVTRAGWDAAGITRFFERILLETKRHPNNIPPYLFSHPEVDDRIDSVRHEAESLRPTRVPDPRFARELIEVQARLAYLRDTGRDTVPPPDRIGDTNRTDAMLEKARRLVIEEGYDEALVVLSRAEAYDPSDPRVAYNIGELLALQGRHRRALEAYRRTVRLDPTRALVFYRLGRSYQAVGDRHSAVHAYEQASTRAGASSTLRKRADWRIETLIFPVLLKTGFAVGAGPGAAADTPLGHTVEVFEAGTTQWIWWGQISDRYSGYSKHMNVRWRHPDGHLVAQTEVDEYDARYIGSVLDLEADETRIEGEWSVEVRYREEPLERRTFEVQRSR
ncbi:MAG: tetratricopeptide repeat protein [Deltaproteobacteria bacterium]|nr:MAG: tetratricopeptide repeat protein [Deltaproteobacteria bacterium]